MNSSLTPQPYEHVVLVDDADRPLGTADKATIHGADTPLHRGFSVFLFNRAGNVLLQQRSLEKITWPGVWSNAVCGHPQLGETTVEAMHRRMRDELGLDPAPLTVVLPGYRYRYAHDGIVEHELCPVAVGVIDQRPSPNPEEVNAVRWMPWQDFLREVAVEGAFSEWCAEETRLLTASPEFQAFYARLAG